MKIIMASGEFRRMSLPAKMSVFGTVSDIWHCFKHRHFSIYVFSLAAAAKSLQSCLTSVRPHRRQPTRLPRPWDSPGKNTGVGCHFLLQCRKVKSESEVTQSCLTLSNPMDCSPPGSPIHGILQARVLEWDAIAFSIFSLEPPLTVKV